MSAAISYILSADESNRSTILYLEALPLNISRFSLKLTKHSLILNYLNL